MLQLLWFFFPLWGYHKKKQVKWVFPSLETCLSTGVSWEKVSIPKHPLLPLTSEEKICLIRCPPVTWKEIRTSLLNVLIFLMSKEQMHPHPLLRPLWMFPASKTEYKLFLHHIHKHEILNSVKWRWVNCSHMDQRHSYMYHSSLWWVRCFNPHEGGWVGLFSVCLILYESIVGIYGSNHAKFSISVFNNHFYFEISPKMDMKRHINMCPLMPMVFILIQIKFDIDTNNDELLETIPKHKKERKKLIITSSVRQHGSPNRKEKVHHH